MPALSANVTNAAQSTKVRHEKPEETSRAILKWLEQQAAT